MIVKFLRIAYTPNIHRLGNHGIYYYIHPINSVNSIVKDNVIIKL